MTHFVAISETIRERIAACYERDSHVIPPPRRYRVLHPAAGSEPREDFYLVVSALVPYKRIDQAVAACRDLGRRLIVIGAGPERARLEKMAGADGPVPGLATRRGDPRPLSPLPGTALSRRGRFRDRAGRGPGLRIARDRPGTGRSRGDRGQHDRQAVRRSDRDPLSRRRSRRGKPRAILTIPSWHAAAPRASRSPSSAAASSTCWPRSPPASRGRRSATAPPGSDRLGNRGAEETGAPVKSSGDREGPQEAVSPPAKRGRSTPLTAPAAVRRRVPAPTVPAAVSRRVRARPRARRGDVGREDHVR